MLGRYGRTLHGIGIVPARLPLHPRSFHFDSATTLMAPLLRKGRLGD